MSNTIRALKVAIALLAIAVAPSAAQNTGRPI
jgi:hypothetical protein